VKEIEMFEISGILETDPPGFISFVVDTFPPLFDEFRGMQFNLLWSGGRDGFRARDFHSHCDGHANTLTLIRDLNGNVFGGFTPVPWQTGTADGQAITDESQKSFLFTLRNPHNLGPRKFGMQTGLEDHAIICNPSQGPNFANVVVVDNCNKSSENLTNWDYLEDFYENLTLIDGATLLTGSTRFTVKEIEVFEITRPGAKPQRPPPAQVQKPQPGKPVAPQRPQPDPRQMPNQAPFMPGMMPPGQMNLDNDDDNDDNDYDNDDDDEDDEDAPPRRVSTPGQIPPKPSLRPQRPAKQPRPKPVQQPRDDPRRATPRDDDDDDEPRRPPPKAAAPPQPAAPPDPSQYVGEVRGGGRVLVNIRNNQIREGSGSKVLFNVRGNDIREGSGSKTVLNVRGNDIRDGSGSTTLLNVRGSDIREGSGSKVHLSIRGNDIRSGSSTVLTVRGDPLPLPHLAAVLQATNRLPQITSRTSTSTAAATTSSGIEIRQGSGSSTVFNIRGNDIRQGSGSTTVCNIRGNDIRRGSGSTTIANIRGNDIRAGSGSTTLFNLRGNDIRQGSGSTTVFNIRGGNLSVQQMAAVLCAAGKLG
jgi:hypothetical protein